MWVKICANTNLEDARLAAELGADALGFVFSPSTRRVTAAQVAEITPHLPDNVERVGVFSGFTPAEIADAVRIAHLTGVQMHDAMDLERIRSLTEAFEGRLQLIQTVHWKIDGGDESEAEFASGLRAASGGTGIAAPWKKMAVLTAPIAKPLILAGGLRPENIAEAIAELNPWGVDVASGVETSPGRKDTERLRAFIANSKSALK